MIERYKVKTILIWGGTRKNIKDNIKRNTEIYDNTAWDVENLSADEGELFTVECIGVCPDGAGYIYEIKTSNDHIIGAIDEENYFRNEYKNFEFLGYVNEEEYNEEML